MKTGSIVSAKKIQLDLFYFRFLTMKLRLVFLTSFLLLQQDVQCCPAGWSEADRLCLKYVTGPQSWDEAGSTCSSMQGHLAEVKDTADNSAVVSFRLKQAETGNPVWLGMRIESGTWRWYDGKPVTWSSWKDGAEPPGMGISTCGMLEQTSGSSVTWSAMPCAMTTAFICQYSDQFMTTEQTKKAQNWLRVDARGEYSGAGTLMVVTSPSRIQCVGQCQSTKNCDTIGYHLIKNTCQLITGGVSSNQITASQDWEIWMKRF